MCVEARGALVLLIIRKLLISAYPIKEHVGVVVLLLFDFGSKFDIPRFNAIQIMTISCCVGRNPVQIEETS